MRIDNQEALELINMNPGLHATVQRRRQFLVSTDETGVVIEDKGTIDRQPGLFHPIFQWDIVPLVRDRRQRVWKRGRAQAISLIYAPDEGQFMPHSLPEEAWAAVIGGRVVATPISVRQHRLQDRRVLNGELDHALILGRPEEPIVIRRCDLESCLFFGCSFHYVRFDDCNFLKSVFSQCIFTDCSFNDCSFTKTYWGDPDYLKNPQAMIKDENAPVGNPVLYNRVRNCVLQGKRDIDGTRGFGPSPFFSPTRNEEEEASVVAVYQARQMNRDPRKDKDARLKVWTNTPSRGQEN